MQALPIDPLLPEVRETLARARRLVLEAPPGAGKTTRVPRAILEAGLAKGEIVVLEPRRLAARMAARRVAEEMGERVGETVGYQVRFEDVSGPRTRMRFVTEGVLTRRMLSDPELRDVGAVVLDEFHERHLHADVALALVRRLARTSRPDLSVVVMSATLATAPIAEYLGAPVLRSEGRLFDVTIEHLPTVDDRPLEKQVASAVRRAITEERDGDVLVFLPGAAEIRRARDACEPIAQQHDLLLLPLHGDLSPAEQDRAVGRADKRKVILATNVAESSVTIDGVVAVVDSGLARVAGHAPWSGLPTLSVEKISRASAVQRTGRAGRTRPGRCLRLYTKADFDTRRERDAPEIRRLDLAQTWLELRANGIRDLPWLDPPEASAVLAATTLLERLGSLDARGDVTALGKAMLRFPLHPRQARLLVEAEARGVGRDGAVLAALVGERDLRVASKARFDGRRRARDAATEPSDLLALLDLFREAEDARLSPDALRRMDLDVGATLAVDRAQKQLARSVRHDRRATEMSLADAEKALSMSVLAGYPDRVARRTKGRTLALGGGGVAELSEESVVRDAPWMVAVDAESQRGRVVVRTASGIEPEWLLDLFPEAIVETTQVVWNAAAERVEATARMLYDGLVLDESPATGASDGEVAKVLAAAATAAGPRRFAPEGALDRWLARARFAAEQGAGLEAPDDAAVDAALLAMCEGRRSFAELRDVSLLDVLHARVGAAAVAAVARFAPERVTLGGGRGVRVEYEKGKPPWIASRLQDFFGMTATPKVAEGRVPLVVHLLAPNQRAVQVTTDLGGFWERHYPALKKELARKYPRHAWPDDPAHASPPVPHGRR